MNSKDLVQAQFAPMELGLPDKTFESAESCNGRRDQAVLANSETPVSINIGPKYSPDIVSDAEVI